MTKKFNPFSDEVIQAAYKERNGVVLTASTSELVKIMGGEVEAQIAQQAGCDRYSWTAQNLKDILEGRRSVIQRDSIHSGELVTDDMN